MEAGLVVIAGGGGGIPVSRAEDGSLHGAEAVIDKDFAAELLAESLDADLLIILTAVEQVAIHFRQPDEAWLSELTPEEAESYIAAGEFAPGSMLPKVEAAVRFARSAPGRTALITELQKKPGPASPEKPARGCGKRNPTWAAIRREAGEFLFPGVWLPVLIILLFDKLCKAWYNHEGSIWSRALPVTVGGLSPHSGGASLSPRVRKGAASCVHPKCFSFVWSSLAWLAWSYRPIKEEVTAKPPSTRLLLK